MESLFDKKAGVVILVLIMITASPACNYPDAVQVMLDSVIDHCVNVSRGAYVTAAVELGQEPENPENPEDVVYEICYVDGHPVSARVIGGEQKDSVGTFRGTITDTEWNRNYGMFTPPETPGTIVENQILIHVGDSGNVTGTLRYAETGAVLMTDTSNEGTCTFTQDQSHRGEAAGAIDDQSGEIVFEGEFFSITYFSEACANGPREVESSEDLRIVIPVTVSQGKITGTSVPVSGERYQEITIQLSSQ